MAIVDVCPHCGENEIFHHRDVCANRPEFHLLPGINTGFLGSNPAKLDVFVCAACGHTMFFVQEEFIEKIREKWTKVEPRLTRHE